MTNVIRRSPEKLQQLAWNANIIQLLPLTKLNRTDDRVPNFLSEPDEQIANSLIASEQSSGFLRKPSIRTKLGLPPYTYKNITKALLKAFDSGCGSGVFQALFKKEQDIAGTKNDETRKARFEQRDGLLSKAITSGNCDLVWVIAPQTSLDARNKGLDQALKGGNADIARKLLECGAEPQLVSKEFLEAAGKGDTSTLDLLLSAPQPLPNKLLLTAIPFAVSSGSLQALQRVVEFTNFETCLEPEAITIALQSARFDMVLVLLFAATQARPDFLAGQVLMLVQRPTAPSESTILFLQALLFAGAAGNECSAALRIVAENQDLEIIRLLVSSGVDVNWGQGIVVKDLVRLGRVELLRALLSDSNVSANSAASAISSLPKNMQEADRLEILDVLIEFGARGRPLEEELVIAVQNNHTRIVQSLREKGVSVDTRAGAALITAIQTENLDLLHKLLEGPVDHNSMQKALLYTQTVSKSLRTKFMRPLLQGQMEGNTLHAILRDIVAEHTCFGVDDAIDALLLAHADPSFEDSQSLKSAIRATNTALLSKLLQCPVGIPESVASSLIPEVLRLQKPNIRPILMKSVLQARPKPDSVSAAVLMLLGEHVCEVVMLELATSSGMVDVNYKTILAQAAIHTDLRALSEIAKLANSHRDTMASAVTRLLGSQSLLQSDKVERLRLLFSSARSSVRTHGAKIGLPIHLKFLSCSNKPGRLWPMEVFEYLLASGAEIPHDSALLSDTVGAGAIQLVKALLGREHEKTHVDDALPSIFNVAEIDQQVELLQILVQAKPSASVLSEMLITAVDKNNNSICTTLLDFGAMLDYNNCAAFRRAVRQQNEILISEILARTQSATILKAAFEEAKLIPDSPQKLVVLQMVIRAGVPKDFVSTYMIEVLSAKQIFEGLLRLLLQEKADPSLDQYRSVVKASTHHTLRIMSMLFEYVADQAGAATKAFDAIVANDKINKILIQRLPVLTFLLQRGAKSPMLDIALIKAVRVHTQSSNLIQLITTLIKSGADVNASQGEALSIASGEGQLEVVSAIFRADIRPNTNSRSRALQHLVDSMAESDDFCAILRLLMDTSATSHEPEASRTRPKLSLIPGIESPIRRLLTKRPHDEKALEQFLNCGCEVCMN